MYLNLTGFIVISNLIDVISFCAKESDEYIRMSLEFLDTSKLSVMLSSELSNGT